MFKPNLEIQGAKYNLFKETILSLSDRNAMCEQELQFILIKIINLTCNINKKQRCYLMLCYSCTPSPLKIYIYTLSYP